MVDTVRAEEPDLFDAEMEHQVRTTSDLSRAEQVRVLAGKSISASKVKPGHEHAGQRARYM